RWLGLRGCLRCREEQRCQRQADDLERRGHGRGSCFVSTPNLRSSIFGLTLTFVIVHSSVVSPSDARRMRCGNMIPSTSRQSSKKSVSSTGGCRAISLRSFSSICACCFLRSSSVGGLPPAWF